MKTKPFLLYFLILSLGLTISSCQKETEPELQKDLPLAHKVNHFTYTLYKDVYLWNEDIPTLNPLEHDDEQAFFKKLIHKDDKWSILTSDIKGMSDSFSGTDMTYGCSYFLIPLSNHKNRVIGLVKYVYANSPAEIAGLKRGNIITKIDGSYITLDNYLDLYYSSSITLGFGEVNNNVISDLDKTAALTAVKMYEDPILATKIFHRTSGNIGYLHYTSYLLDSHKKLNNVFSDFKSQAVKDVILDLRYNGGGYVLTSLFLSSLLTTKAALKEKDIATIELWNPRYNEYFVSKGIKKEDRFTESLEYTIDGNAVVDEVTSNLDLSRLYVLVSKSSASASESTIASLELYLDITLIGDTTAGKFCGGMLLSPSKDFETAYPEIKDWGSYTMIYRFANKNGVTNCIGGYAPDYEVEEDIRNLNLMPIGDEQDPLIAKALKLITGVPTPASRDSSPTSPEYELIEHNRNMLDGKLIKLTSDLQ